jgi:hypothetical protein
MRLSVTMPRSLPQMPPIRVWMRTQSGPGSAGEGDSARRVQECGPTYSPEFSRPAPAVTR